ncbi:TolC family protein [Neokomagataea thailandica]|uniref:Cobalt/zinc/cadmium resistance heavy metal efflux pump protein CzcC n=1 Tax=Neokomagataea tanensis NBRC 106556 TaxID=1223519 RepID=A0ABQ0QKY5_9PROT|nr:MULTISPECIES: TolC family protein [Neokomagataea]GBR48550.1 cobalt/zinc/cadmium resistance heavy metal efflux pump protein CzcC [Neokomagataea tanensis NBRC 106556]
MLKHELINQRTKQTVFGVVALLAVFQSGVAWAGEWSFHDAVRSAWERDPAQTALHTAERSSLSEAYAARSWFPAGMVVNAQYTDDHFIGSNQGYTTYQGQFSMPFWLPGQGRATERRALADAGVARANSDMERMAQAMQLLDVTVGAAIAQKQFVVVQEEAQAAEALLGQSVRRLRVGEEPRTEHDALVGFVGQLHQQRAEIVENLAGYQADMLRLTGTRQVPDIEGIDGRDLARLGRLQSQLIVERDPRVIYADAVEKASGAELDVVRHSWMPTPTAGVQVIRQKQFEALWDTSVGVQATVQLPSSAQYTPRLMQQVRVQANAARDHEQARRIVEDEYTHTLMRLQTSLAVVSTTRDQCAAQSDRAEQVTRAWRVGESALVEVLRARQGALGACLALKNAEISWHGAIVRLMISGGETP